MFRQGICRGAWLVTLAPGLVGGLTVAGGLGEQRGGDRSPAATEHPVAARVHCPAPETLRLRRFEDGSAQLRCARRVIVRVSVPG